MTSSLVGSEMCIRDRANCACCWVCFWTSLRRPGIPRETWVWEGYSLEPVSYTHLTLPTICSV
eukprot:8090131-Prorocentrum_lima.AAC.1